MNKLKRKFLGILNGVRQPVAIVHRGRMVEDDNNVNRLRHRNARNVKLNLGNARCLEVVSAGLARGGLTDSDRTLVRIFGVILRWRGIGVGICIQGCSDASCNGFAR